MTSHILIKRPRGQRPPLRSLAEMAESFGVTWQALSLAIARDENRPRPVMKTGRESHTTTQASYYDPREMRAWWARRQQGVTSK